MVMSMFHATGKGDSFNEAIRELAIGASMQELRCMS